MCWNRYLFTTCDNAASTARLGPINVLPPAFSDASSQISIVLFSSVLLLGFSATVAFFTLQISRLSFYILAKASKVAP